MIDGSALLLVIGLGLRHATDADHVAVVSSLVQRQPGILRAARVAMLWGLGHCGSFLGVGALVIFVGLRIPEAFEQGAELLVAFMLVSLGAFHLLHHPEARSKQAISAARPVVVGLVHGLAGSAGMALLVATTIRSQLWALLYLATFGLGTVIGMGLLTMALSRPLAWTGQQRGALGRLLARSPAICNLLLGASLAVHTLLRVKV
jgi:hypothetical protein